MGRTLLLADDSVTIQKVVSLTFASEGVEIITANDGQEALDKLGERTPDVALLDVFMPKLDGYEVCSYIKQDERFSNIPVILLVGAFEPYDQEKARLSGADDYLTKPFQSIRQLVTKVNDLLQASAARAAAQTVTEAPLTPPAAEETIAETPSESPIVLSETTDEVISPEHISFSETPEFVAEQDEPISFQPDILPLAGEDLDDSSIEITSISTPAAANAQAAPLPAETISEPVYQNSPAKNFFEDNDHLLELEDLVVAAPLAEADDDDVLRIYEEIKLPQPDISLVSETPLVSDAQTGATLTAETPEILETMAPEAAATADNSAPVELSPAAIDAIARRVVELMSDRAVREIAWEVVPDMADLHLKQRIAETK